MPFDRTRIAAGTTLAALGVLAAVALNAGGKPSASQPTAAPKPEVRTEVIRRTVRVSRKHSESAPGPVRPAAQPRAGRPATPAPAASGASYGDDDHSGHSGGDGDGAGDD